VTGRAGSQREHRDRVSHRTAGSTHRHFGGSRGGARAKGRIHGPSALAGPSQHEAVMNAQPTAPLNVVRNELPPARPIALEQELAYAPGAIVSRTIAKARGGSITLFAFDAGQDLSEHTAPFDAFVQVLDGSVELTIGGAKVVARAGETVRMPAGIPHAVRAIERFKMILTMVREPA
jgi:quercetin dioxygenase-like cupin family protein